MFQSREYARSIYAANGGANHINYRANWPCRAEAMGKGGYALFTGRWLSKASRLLAIGIVTAGAAIAGGPESGRLVSGVTH